MKLRQRIEELIAEMNREASWLREEHLMEPDALKVLKRAQATAIENYANRLQEELDFEQPPYIEKTVTETTREYNPNYGDSRRCVCGHPYERHFDSYENNRAVGCKYCTCYDFVEDVDLS